jgi:two-component system LytT family response regulator
MSRQKSEKLLYSTHYMNGHKKISLPTPSGFEFYTINDIVRCEADNNYTIFHLLGARKILASKNLGEYEEMFAGYYFFRVHQSHLINLRHVKSYLKNKGAVILTDDSMVEISRRKKLPFFEQFSF